MQYILASVVHYSTNTYYIASPAAQNSLADRGLETPALAVQMILPETWGQAIDVPLLVQDSKSDP